MTDTQRTLTGLKSLLADNSAAAISAQDVRDFLVSVYPAEFNVKNYGAVGDGVTDDSTAIQTAINAADLVNGTVVFPPTTDSYLINTGLTAGRVSMIGAGAGVTIKAGASMTYMIQLYYNGSGDANFFARYENILLDGNSNADKCWDIGVSVQRYWFNCGARNAVHVGVLLNGTQNCNFYNMTVEDNGSAANDGGVRINNKAYNNRFFGCEITSNAGHNIIIAQSSTLDTPDSGFTITGINEPRFNIFFGCQVERSDATGFVSTVRMRAGHNNGFIGCNITTTGTTLGEIIFECTGADVALVLPFVQDCYIQSNSDTLTTMFKVTSTTRFVLMNTTLNNSKPLFHFTDTSTVVIGPGCQLNPGSSGTFFSSDGSLAERQHFQYFNSPFNHTVRTSGTWTIPSGSTSVSVTHGLATTPAARGIHITATNNPTNAPGHIWISSIGATSFTINCENDPGSGGFTGEWAAEII